ncbi:MAG: helix-turn-helix transcriptional regulator [Candidatus Woesebacteria bacterium]|nr:helix-turn-helix transcriptional regulator [Candidatus Woesebacteria bacterium]
MAVDITKKFGQKVRKVRIAKGMSQGKLAKKLGVDSSYISKIERGLQNISLKGLEKLAKVIGVSVGELMK